MLSCEFCNIFKNTYFKENLWSLLLMETYFNKLNSQD